MSWDAVAAWPAAKADAAKVSSGRLQRERVSMSWTSGKGTCLQLTILKDTLHIQAVGGAGLVVGATLQVAGQFAGARVVDDARIAFADGV